MTPHLRKLISKRKCLYAQSKYRKLWHDYDIFNLAVKAQIKIAKEVYLTNLPKLLLRNPKFFWKFGKGTGNGVYIFPPINDVNGEKAQSIKENVIFLILPLLRFIPSWVTKVHFEIRIPL